MLNCVTGVPGASKTAYVVTQLLNVERKNKVNLKKNIVVFEHNKACFEKFKDGVKDLNSEYPRADDGKTISTTKISPKDLCRHIEFIKDFASYYGFELAIVEAEWERIKQMAR